MNIRILYVEDDEIDRMALERKVRRESLPYDMETAGSIVAASELLKKKSYDLVLLDYMLPDGTGLEILDKLKGTPSIFVTGSGDERVAVKAMKGGANDYIIKDNFGGYLLMLPIAIDKAMEEVRLKREKKEAEEKLREKLDVEQRFNKLLLQREFRIKELKNENDGLKARIEEMEKVIKKE